MRARLTLILVATASLSGVALAQRAVRPKDAPAPMPDTPDELGAPQSPAPEPLVPTPGGRRRSAPIDAPAPRGDGGPLLKPTFKDDLTADDAKRTDSAVVRGCGTSPCEGVLRRRLASRDYLLHVRPAQPRLGEVAEIVVEVSELLDPPDPELGDKKPEEGLALVAHLEGVGRYQLHPVDGSTGSYGFHFTPQAKGSRRLTIEPAAGGKGPAIDFDIPIGQPAAKGASYELHPYELSPNLDAVGRDMFEIGAAWGSLWASAQSTGHGDAAALAKTVQRFAKASMTIAPASAADRRGAYAELARSFSEATERLSGAKGSALKEALSFIEEQQCNRCHAAYAWGIASDVSNWPQFMPVGKETGE